MEAGVLLDLQGQALHWHLPPGRTSGSLPESPDLWDVIWTNRDNISGFAHSHPGGGVPGPSFTDVTTFAAIEAGLAARLDWWIASEDGLALYRWKGPDRLSYSDYPGLVVSHIFQAPAWLTELRRLSYHPQM